MPFSFASVRARTQDQRDILKWGALSVGSESAPHFNMSLWSWVRALKEAKEKGMGHAPIACEWDRPSSEWARGWGPYKKVAQLVVGTTSNGYLSSWSQVRAHGGERNPCELGG